MSTHLNMQAGLIFKELMRMMMTTFASYKDCKARPPRVSSKHAKSQLFVTEGLLNQHLRTLGIIFANANSLLSHSKLRDYILDSLESLDVTLSQLTEVLLQACSSQQSKLASNVVAACKLLYYSLVEACQGASYLSVLRKRELLSLLITTFLECLEKNTQGEAAESIQRNEIMLSLLYELLIGAPHKESDSTLVRLAKALLILIETSISPIIIRLSIRIASEIWPILNPSVFPQDVVQSLFKVLGKYVLKADCQPCPSDDKLFSVMLHSNNDEDLGFLLPVLLEWENKYQYLQGRLVEENKEEELVQESEQFLEEWLGEQAFIDFMPEQLRSGDFPVEQYYQYILGQERGGWSRGRGARRPSGRRATGRRPAPKKASNNVACATLSKLEKLLEERVKALEEVKAEDDEGEKTRKSNERLFFKRLRQMLRDSQTIAGNLSLKGAAAVLEPMPRAKALELVALIYQVQQQLLVDSKTKLPILPASPYAKQAGEAVATEVIKAKRLLVCSLVDSQIVQKLEYVLESGSTLSVQRVMDRLSADITGAYSHPLMSRTVQAGAAFSICINQIIRLIKDLLQAERWSGYIQTSVREAIVEIKDWEAKNAERQMQVIGALVIAGGWSDYVRPGSLVAVDRSNAQEMAIVLQGGSMSGMKNVTLIFPNDLHATPQSLPLKEVKFVSRQLDPTDLSVTHDLLAEAIVSMQGSSALKFHLLKTCSALNWSEWLSRQDPALSSQFVNQLVAMSVDCPIDKTPTVWEETHALLWEQLIDQQEPNFSLIAMPAKPETQMDFLSGQLGESPETGLMAYTLPSSSYISSLPEDRSSRRSDISLKMLKYWEKYIIPRIQDFVRSSFKTYEMEYFFEQLRQPLRLGDQAKAIEIAMVLCDNKLPSGVILPDMNHDWSAVTIDECMVGSWVITKLKSKSLAHLESSLLRRYQWQGVSEVPAIVRVVDLRANLVLIEIVDVEQLEMTQLWVPVSSLFFPDRTPPLPSNAHQYDSLRKRYSDCSQAIRSIHARETLLQCLSQASISTLTPYISIVDIAKWLVWEELTEDSVEGWLNTRHDYFFPCAFKPPETFSVTNYVHEPQLRDANERSLEWLEEQLIQLQEKGCCQERDALLNWTVGAWHELGDQLSGQKRCIDIAELSKLISGPVQNIQITPQSIVTESGNDKKCFPLHFGSDHNCGVVVSFQKAAFLCGNSKLQFFADAAGEELLLELKAGKAGRGTLAPVVFKQGQVWCAYSTFLDAACSVYNQAQEGTTTLACEVCLIPWNWTALTWLTEALTAVLAKKPTPEGIQQIHSLNYAVIYVLNTSKAPAPIRQQLFRLLTRVMRRLRYIHCESHSSIPHFEGMGVQDSWLQSLVEEVKTLRDNEFKGSDTLFSSYLQDAVEFLATTMLPWDYYGDAAAPKLAVPEWVEAMIKTLCFLNYFRSEGPLRKDILALLQEALAYNQWYHVYVIRNIAKPIDALQSTIAGIASANKVRIVDLESDVIAVDEHTAMLITDGLSLAYYQDTTFEEEEKKEEQAEEVKEPEVWECPTCTLQNPNALNECEACGAPRVVRPAEVPKQADVPHTNVAEVQLKLNTNAETALQEFLTTLESALSSDELKCTVTRVKAEDEDILNKALRQRLLDTEGKLRTQVISKLEQPGNEFAPLFSAAQGGDLKELFRSAVETNAFETMKRLETAGIDLWLESALGGGQEQLSLKRLEQLMLAVECEMCQETRAVLYIPSQFLRFPETSRLSSISGKCINVADILITQYPELIGVRLRELRFHWALLKLFNYNLSEAIGLLNLQQHQLLPRGSLTLSTSSAISEIRGLIMLPIKVEMQQRVFEKTAIHRENPPKVILERLKLQKEVKKDSVFLKAFEQMKDFNPALFRIPKPRGADPFIAFQVVFKGELVVGEAGPYRQFFADISRDLQSDRTLGLFCPSVNNKERLGTSRDRFVIVPSTTSAHQLQLFEFLGVLMGCCVRTGTRLILDLPSFLWKPLVGQNLRLEDLQSIDYPACEMMKLVESAGLDLFEESFENFCARLSDETIVDLKPNGRFIPVTYENKNEFISKLLQCRFQESQKQCEAMRKGLSRLVPSGMLNLVTWKQLENWVCGKPLVDLELLKRHTRLSGGLEDSSPRVQWFWEILTEFSPDERLRFIKFSWGQDRLPGNDEEFERTNTRLMLKPSMMEGNVDGRLPKADTCFFNLELPNYSSKEVMKRQLRFAITADCDSMNADEPVSEQPDNQLRGGEHYSEEEDNME
jgi:other hect domain ubiquitin protein ligase E3